MLLAMQGELQDIHKAGHVNSCSEPNHKNPAKCISL
jgi:hypothetical protein